MTDGCTYVIFGATGNLATTKLLPALYHLDKDDRLPPDQRVVCCGRRPYEKDQWLALVEKSVAAKARGGLDAAVFARFAARVSYFRGDLAEAEMYSRLRDELSDAALPGNVAFYMSVGPAQYGQVVEHLAQVGLLAEDGYWTRVVVE